MKIESVVKAQFARILRKDDWRQFKTTAEYYLQNAACLKKRDIESSDSDKLLIRNSQKRLFIGIGCELLLKAVYLKEGYCINKNRQQDGIELKPTYKMNDLQESNIKPDDTFTFNQLIDYLKKISESQNLENIIHGLKIAKVFRNKEGHIAVRGHKFDPQNYSDIEDALINLYQDFFNEKLSIKISMQADDSGLFKVK